MVISMQPFYSQIEYLKKRFSTKLSKGKKKKGSGFRNYFLFVRLMKLREKSMKGRQLEKRENLFVIDKNQLLYYLKIDYLFTILR